MTSSEAKPFSISRQSLQRMPVYLELLKKIKAEGRSHVSAAFLASVSSVDGNPRIGFALDGLIDDMSEFLGCNNAHEAVVAGVGNLGRALLSYKNFSRYGLAVIAGFDTSRDVVGTTVAGKEIFDASRISELCARLGVHIGIITVPAEAAQSTCDAMVAGGILAVWNFAPVHLSVPDGVIVSNENLAASFAALSSRLCQMNKK